MLIIGVVYGFFLCCAMFIFLLFLLTHFSKLIKFLKGWHF